MTFYVEMQKQILCEIPRETIRNLTQSMLESELTPVNPLKSRTPDKPIDTLL